MVVRKWSWFAWQSEGLRPPEDEPPKYFVVKSVRDLKENRDA